MDREAWWAKVYGSQKKIGHDLVTNNNFNYNKEYLIMTFKM